MRGCGGIALGRAGLFGFWLAVHCGELKLLGGAGKKSQKQESNYGPGTHPVLARGRFFLSQQGSSCAAAALSRTSSAQTPRTTQVLQEQSLLCCCPLQYRSVKQLQPTATTGRTRRERYQRTANAQRPERVSSTCTFSCDLSLPKGAARHGLLRSLRE